MKYLIQILFWCVYLLIWIPLLLIGWVLIPLAAVTGSYAEGKSRVYDKVITRWKRPIMYPWGNEEDGIVAGEQLINWPIWIRIIYWSAFRNPVNNLRFVKYLRCDLNPGLIEYMASFSNPLDDDLKGELWYYCYQGYYSNYRAQFKLFGQIYRFWIGWKIYPSSIQSIPEYQRHGVGFALQLKRVR